MRVISSGSVEIPRKPFLLVSMGVEIPALGSTPEMRTQSIPFTVWVHDEPGGFTNIDDAAMAIKNGLPTLNGFMIGGLSVYEIRWEATGEDVADDHFKSDARPVRFTAMTRRAG
jgi:hypothetical protein